MVHPRPIQPLLSASILPDVPMVIRPNKDGTFSAFYNLPGSNEDPVYYAGDTQTAAGAETKARLSALGLFGRMRRAATP